MRACGDQILGIAGGILDTATMQAGTVPIEAVAFEPHAVVEEVCAQRMAAAREKGLALTHYVAPSVPLLLLGARSRVRQVLTTLVDNAIDFSESGDIRIGARLVSVGPDDVQIRFDVTDCSSALASDRQAALFAELGAHDESDGPAPRGVALAVCRRVVAALRGEIGIETVFGGNNVFWFTIRCSEVGATHAPSAPEGPVTIRAAARAVSIEEDGPPTRRTGS